jgi:hypothetical protein
MKTSFFTISMLLLLLNTPVSGQTKDKWIPQGWKKCDAQCERYKADGKQVSCPCTSSCLALGKCGCRTVRRQKIALDRDEPEGWRLGPVELVRRTCETPFKADKKYLYKCACLERA